MGVLTNDDYGSYDSTPNYLVAKADKILLFDRMDNTRGDYRGEFQLIYPNLHIYKTDYPFNPNSSTGDYMMLRTTKSISQFPYTMNFHEQTETGDQYGDVGELYFESGEFLPREGRNGFYRYEDMVDEHGHQIISTWTRRYTVPIKLRLLFNTNVTIQSVTLKSETMDIGKNQIITSPHYIEYGNTYQDIILTYPNPTLTEVGDILEGTMMIGASYWNFDETDEFSLTAIDTDGNVYESGFLHTKGNSTYAPKPDNIPTWELDDIKDYLPFIVINAKMTLK
jgi:hypothetical protein